jgi:glycosyltransferase involved in cell wall biosynthesis
MVSVVIPSYNEESRIGSVLEAVVGSKSVDEVWFETKRTGC